MPEPKPDAFRDAVLAAYEQPAAASDRLGLAAQFDAGLRTPVAEFWNLALFLEARAMNPPRDDSGEIQKDLHGQYQQLIELWKQSVLARPRATLPPTDPTFRSAVLDRYAAPCPVVSPADLGQSLDTALAGPVVGFREFVHQLFRIADALGRVPDAEIAAQAKITLTAFVNAWKRSVLAVPRARTDTAGQERQQ